MSLSQIKKRAIKLAKQYGVKRLYLLGSVLTKADSANDYDFAVEGVPRGEFFNFYGALLKEFPKNIDLINLTGPLSLFKKIIKEDGKIIYEAKKN